MKDENEIFMSTLNIDLEEFSKEELIAMIVEANELDITFNELMNRVISEAVEKFEKSEDKE